MNDITEDSYFKIDALSKSEKDFAMITHIAGFAGYVFPFGNIIGPLIIWLLKKEESEFVRIQGLNVLNFQISITIAYLIAIVLCFLLIGIPILLFLLAFHFIIMIKGAMKASEGQKYIYPLSFNFLK